MYVAEGLSMSAVAELSASHSGAFPLAAGIGWLGIMACNRWYESQRKEDKFEASLVS